MRTDGERTKTDCGTTDVRGRATHRARKTGSAPSSDGIEPVSWFE